MSKRVTLTDMEVEYILNEINDDLKYHPSSIMERRSLEALRNKLQLSIADNRLEAKDGE